MYNVHNKYLYGAPIQKQHTKCAKHEWHIVKFAPICLDLEYFFINKLHATDEPCTRFYTKYAKQAICSEYFFSHYLHAMGVVTRFYLQNMRNKQIAL